MLREQQHFDALKLISPQHVRSYAIAKGWQRVPKVNGNIALFQRPTDDWRQLIVPMDESMEDYSQRIFEVVEKLAELESRSIVQVLNDLIMAEADVLRYRVMSSATGKGTVPLVEGFKLLEGAKKSVLAAACSVVHPVSYHPRMTQRKAQQLLQACQLGQTERGSFTLTVSCPLRAVEEDQSLLPGSIPFTRQATVLLIQSMHEIVSAIESDRVSQFVDSQLASAESNEQISPTSRTVISANLCSALLNMQPSEEDSDLTVSATWAATLPNETDLPTSVRIKRDYFPIIGDVYEELRPSESPTASLFVAYVDTLNGQPNKNGEVQGDVTLSVFYEEELWKAHVDLGAAEYQIAVDAHRNASMVRFKGILHPGRRSHRITDVSNFDHIK